MCNAVATSIEDTPVGPIQLEAGPQGLRTVRFGAEPSPLAGNQGPLSARELLGLARRQLCEYFEGRLRTFDLPLDLRGTPFQVAVWQALLAIPFGQTASYGHIARRIGRPKAVRAVGAANGANPISIIVPCHRIIGSDRTLTGYGGGLPAKRCLLRHEGNVLTGDRVDAPSSLDQQSRELPNALTG